MPKKTVDTAIHDTPIFCLDAFSTKADHAAFYIENFKQHLTAHEFVSHPHKHDFYLVLYVTKGSGNHTIDFNTYPVAPGTFFLMTPGQVHSWHLSDDADGVIIFFERDFYQMHLAETSVVEFPFFHSLNTSPVAHLHDTVIDTILNRMLDEYNRPTPDPRLLRSYLDVVLLTLARAYHTHEEIQLSPVIFKLRKLEQLIEKNFIKQRQPNAYAELMHLSPSYLNSICKHHLGKTLSDLIQERVVLEAKRLFAYTDLTLNQVAAHLKFTDASYFARFFKKHTGITPDQFKESLNRPV